MDRTEWITNRVRWRLSKHGNVVDAAVLDADIPDNYVAEIAAAVPTAVGTPLLAFIESPLQWTILTTDLVASRHNGGIHFSSVNGDFSVNPPYDEMTESEAMNVKSTLQFLLLTPNDSKPIKIWAPAGAPLFALWNVLLMFPFHRWCASRDPIQ